jgi:hypothetical protein
VTRDQAEWVAHVISETLRRGAKVAEVTEEAQQAWVKEIEDKAMERTNYREECTPRVSPQACLDLRFC